MLSKKGNRNTNMQTGDNRDNIFWNLFLQTGSIDAYLLLKEEESERNKESKA